MPQRLLRAAIAAAVLLAAGVAASGCGGGGSPQVSIANSLQTIRFDQPLPGSEPSADLIAARNEFESFQVAVDAGGGMSGLRIAPEGPLRGPGGAQIPLRDITTYREVPYEVGKAGTPPSDSEGEPGLWPDALIPQRDSLYGERRNAFPVDLDAGEKTAAWIDVFADPASRPGEYRGSVKVSNSSGLLKRVPVRLRVEPFAIPSTTSLPSAFGLDPAQVCQAFSGRRACAGPEQAWRLVSLFARLGLGDRMTISDPWATGFGEAPDAAGRQLLERDVGPLISGDQRGLRPAGARLTALNVYWECLDPQAVRTCLSGWRDVAAAQGFSDRFFIYLCDEPDSEAALWAECRARARRADSVWPQAPRLITASEQEARRFGGLDYTDILAPIVNDITAPLGGSWFYTSCQSYGCGPGGSLDTSTEGFPGYAIDEPATEQRASGWLGFQFGAGGELYYQTVSELPTAWSDQYRSGGNGDGTLFYPGLPDGGDGGPAIGGRDPIPLDSIRMKRIRDGREDFEYLRLLAGSGRRAEAESIARDLFGPVSTAMHSTDIDPEALLAARSHLAALISAG